MKRAWMWLLLLNLSPVLWCQGQELALMSNKQGKVYYKASDDIEREARDPEPLRDQDRLRTLAASGALIKFRADQSTVRIGPSTSVVILKPDKSGAVVRVLEGMFYYFNRDKKPGPGFRSRHVNGAFLGTEYAVVVDEARTTVALYEGSGLLANEHGQLLLGSGEAAVVEAGQAPVKQSINATNLVQWWLYYPGVLDVGELPWTSDEQHSLGNSLRLYRQGDIAGALAAFPGFPQLTNSVASTNARIYLAGLLVSSDELSRAQGLLASLPPEMPAVRALRWMIDAVQQRTDILPGSGSTASEWLALSYYHQARHDLAEALLAARKAAELSPEFAFAYVRVAELQFAFGSVHEAEATLERAMEFGPRNAQASALRGFILSAQNKRKEARAAFNSAIELNPKFGNAYLGRGLTRIQRGDADGGRDDLKTAAILEPNRALLRSYLAKAFVDAGDKAAADLELRRAIELDPNDPTPWLYSALKAQEENEINRAIRALETSQELNDNRRLYRSRLLLDQDRAVRGAHLASIFLDANMEEVSFREASQALAADYANYSAHLFLADSYNALRDPRQVNLRYETPWFSSYVVANLLAPVGARTLAPGITQHEYSRFFDHDGAGFSSATEYRSSGDWMQAASHYGRYGNVGYALDLAYTSENGYRPNSDFWQLTTSARVKQEITAQDSIYIQGIYYRAEGGDLRQLFQPSDAQTGLRFKEWQEPLLVGGYHREWSPGSHTLMLGTHWHDTLEVTDPAQPLLFFARSNAGDVIALPTTVPSAPLEYESRFDGYSMELQQIQQLPGHTLVGGARIETGTFHTENRLGAGTPTTVIIPAPMPFPLTLPVPPSTARVREDFDRYSIYLYDHWQALEPLLVIGGISYDHVEFPANHRSPPVHDGQDSVERISPKAGLVYSPARHTVVRGGYAKSVSGVSFDQSLQLEPTQIAGFTQTYRSLVPESVIGSAGGSRNQIAGLALDQKFGRGTFFTASGEWLHAALDRHLGAADFSVLAGSGTTTTAQSLSYYEKNLNVTLNQLLGDNWSVGARYRLSVADLSAHFTDLPAALADLANQDLSATLHRVHFFALFNHASGFFGQAETIWSQQSLEGHAPGLRGDDFWHLNGFVGYRFWDRRVETRLALLNITDQDYNLAPLNLSSQLPHSRTLALMLRFSL